ncbi:cupin domain-containing protein [Phytohalomonas tamaricis]|uniref:cupin domain-containing protein n=1 Tax=Phytohalomonas tamaricis TaxID=2081032 RepID=UPI000D0AFF33|nr:cupin domain-containing protein [Phytohalomonas tamaricis]
MMRALIERYGLTPHPEGGHYRQVYQASQSVYSTAACDQRAAVTHIYFMLMHGEVSRFHKVLHDELWHVYEGAPIRLIRYQQSHVEETVIGAGCGDYCAVVPGGCYQAAESTGDYTLVGCTVAPGFEFDDFSFLSDAADDALPVDMHHAVLHRFL